MLKRLAEAHPESVARLTLQYRMNEEICQISNDIIYDGALKCANESVRHRKLDLVGFSCPVSPWLEHVLDPSLPVVFVNTDTQTNTPTFASAPRELEETIGHGSIVNKVEKTISETIVRRLLSCGMDPSEIGVICPFRAQVRLLP